MISKRLLAISLLVVYISISVYRIPIPDGLNDPNKVRFLAYRNEIAFRIINFLDFIGIYRDYKAIRWLREDILQDKPVEGGVPMKDLTWNGVKVRVYSPKDKKKRRKAMIFYHGGGFVLGTLNTYHKVTSYLAEKADMVVVSVDYRLCPEHSRRDALEDCVTATKYLMTHAAKFGVDPKRIVIAGDSAGGNLAAAVALRLRDDSFDPAPKLQLLIYPVVQGIDLQMPSYQQNPDGPFLSNEMIYWFLSHSTVKTKRYMHYFRANTHVPGEVQKKMAKRFLDHALLPNHYKYPPYKQPEYDQSESEIWHKLESDFLDPYLYPLMAEDLTDLPEAFVFTAQYDPLRDEGFLYAERLRKDGVEVTYYNSPLGWHGMINGVGRIQESTDAMDKIVNFINDHV